MATEANQTLTVHNLVSVNIHCKEAQAVCSFRFKNVLY